jgi:hypothetical protein
LSHGGSVLSPEGYVSSHTGSVLSPEGYVLSHGGNVLCPVGCVICPGGNVMSPFRCEVCLGGNVLGPVGGPKNLAMGPEGCACKPKGDSSTGLLMSCRVCNGVCLNVSVVTRLYMQHLLLCRAVERCKFLQFDDLPVHDDVMLLSPSLSASAVLIVRWGCPDPCTCRPISPASSGDWLVPGVVEAAAAPAVSGAAGVLKLGSIMVVPRPRPPVGPFVFLLAW